MVRGKIVFPYLISFGRLWRGRPWRPALRRWVRSTPVMLSSSLAMERGAVSALATTHSRDIFSSFSSSPPQTLAAATRLFLLVAADRNPSVGGETKQLEWNHDVAAGSRGAYGGGDGRIRWMRGRMVPGKSSRRRRAVFSRSPAISASSAAASYLRSVGGARRVERRSAALVG
jgi:hypothetical protein